jgi:hypothetical protein
MSEFKSNIFGTFNMVTKVHFRRGSSFLGTNLDWFEANWILELDYTLVPSVILGSPNEELSF